MDTPARSKMDGSQRRDTSSGAGPLPAERS